jgi:outer membrane biosynthesis protein TonB
MIAIRHAGTLPRHLPARRMLIALGVSLFVHFLVVGGWGGSGAARTVAIVRMPLQAQLEPMPAALPQPAEVDTPLVINAAQVVVPSRRTPPATAAVTQSPAGSAASRTDPRFYLARELDRYPSPLSALGLDHGREAAGRVRLWVSIDQAGQVVDAAVIEADPPGEIERLARERVLATRFMPAWRDGRPVKSRVLLVLLQGA